MLIIVTANKGKLIMTAKTTTVFYNQLPAMNVAGAIGHFSVLVIAKYLN